MTIIRLFLLILLLVPVLFVTGTLVSSADVLIPFSAGAYQDGLGRIAQAGEDLRAATQGLTIKEINFVYKIIQRVQDAPDIFEQAESLQRIKSLTERSI